VLSALTGYDGWVRAVDVSERNGRPVVVFGTDRVHYRVRAENVGLENLVEVEARLWHIEVDDQGYRTRRRIPIEVDKLMVLPGKWSEARRTQQDTGGRSFRFRLPVEVSPEGLADRDEYLFQVWSKHGFTNFGRVHKLRLIPRYGLLAIHDDDKGGRFRFERVTTGIAKIAKRRGKPGPPPTFKDQDTRSSGG
jgi:hypothetical protein